MLAYAVRHAESLANTRLEAGLNSGLSPLGRQQADRLANRFCRVEIAAIYSSPFLRSIETALPVANRLNLPIRIRPELCEFQGLPSGMRADLGLGDLAAIARPFQQVIPCPDYRQQFAWPPCDETLGEMVARVQSFARYLKERWLSPEDTVILVGHGSPTARLIEAWLTDLPGPSFRFTIDNAAVAALRYHLGVSSLVCLNEISHLCGLAPAQGANYREDGAIKPAADTSYW